MDYKESTLITTKASGSGVSSGYQVSGYLTRWGEVDGYSDCTVRGSFLKTIAENKNPFLLWSHEYKMLPLGIVRGWHEDNTGVFFIAQIASTSAGEDVKHLLNMGSVDMMGVSYGYLPIRHDYTTKSGSRVRRLLEVDCKEVSLTAFPALKSARLLSASAKDALAIGLYDCSLACGLPVSKKMTLDYLDAMLRKANSRKSKLLEIELHLGELRLHK